MATITIEIGTKGKNKQRSVRFLVRQSGRRARISTGITVTDAELTSNGKKIKEPNKAKLLEKKRRELPDRLDAMMIEQIGDSISAEEIVERLTIQPQVLDFFVFADEWIGKSAVKDKKNYGCMLNSLERYLGHRKLPFKQITYKLLEGYELVLKDKPRAQSLYLGLMRHLYREAMRRYNTDFDTVISHDPFLRYCVPKQQVKKGVRALTLEQILAIYNYKGRAHSRAQLARDCFILSFCLMGMNSVDMYEARDIKDNAIRYNRAKTKDRRSDNAYIEVMVHPVIADLIRRYKGSGRVFSFCERYADAQAFNKAVNIGLKEVGMEIGIEGLQFYQARHTFATLSRNMMHFSKSDVDEALNHVGSYDIADIYIAKDFSIINNNNFKLLDRVFGLKKGKKNA